MTTISWNNGVNADWTTGAAWIGNIAPTTGDDAVIDVAGSYTVTIAALEAVTVHSATLNDAGATLEVDGTLNLAGTTPSLQVQAGEVLLSGAIAGGTVQLGANALSASGAAKVTGALDAAGGAITIAGATTLTLGNGGSLDSGEQILGPGTFATAGAFSVGTGGILVDGSLVWINSGSISVDGQIQLNYPSQLGTDTIVNQAAGVISLVSDTGAISVYGSGNGVISNAGLLTKTAGSGTSTVGAVLNSTGTINVATGTLALSGTLATGGGIGGKVTGAGVVDVTGGTATLATGLVSSAHLLEVTGGTLAAAGNVSVTGGFGALTGGTVQVATGTTLTISGAATVDGGVLLGPGTLATTGATTVTGNGAYFDGSMVWANSGSASVAGLIQLNYPSQLGTDTIINQATGVIALTSNSGSISPYGSGNGVISNAGLLTKTAGSGTSNIGAVLNSTGTINATTGTLALGGGGSISGKITGAGVVDVTGGTATLAAGLVSSAHMLEVTGGTLAAAGNASVTGGFGALTGGTMQVAASKTLTVSGPATMDGGSLLGPGTLATTGTTTVTSNGAYFDGSLVWANSGSASVAGLIQLNYPSQLGTDTIINQAAGVISLVSDTGAISVYGSGNGVINNAGVLAKAGGSGTSTITAVLNNTGTLTATMGTLDLSGGGTFGANTTITTGAGVVAVNGGTFTVAAAVTTATIAGALALTGGTVQIDVGKTLTISGAATLEGSVLLGSGTLATTSSTTVTASGANFDGSMAWVNSGSASVAGLIQLNFPSQLGTDTIINKAAGIIDLTGDSGAISPYGSGNGVISNAGLLTKTAGSGTSTVGAVLNSTGTINVATGTLALSGALATGGGIGGKVTGAGVVDVTGGTATLATGLVSSAHMLEVTGGTLAAAGNASVTGGFGALTGGTMQVAASKTLTVSGAATMDGGLLLGPGTLATTSTTTVTGNGANFDASMVWSNSGSASVAGLIQLDFASQLGTSTIINQPTGVISLTSDSGAINIYGSGVGIINNAGVLAKTGGSGASIIGAVLNSNGTLAATVGTLDLSGGGTFGANTTITTGAGVVAVNGGTFTVAAAVTTATIAGALALTGGTVQIDVGKTLTISGAATLEASILLGPGTLATTGSTTVTASGVNFDGSMVWANSGSASVAGLIQLNYPSQLGTDTIVNQAGGVIALTSDSASIKPYVSSNGVISNAGLLTKTGGTGTSTVATLVNNTGSVTATTGTLELDAGGTLDGEVGGGIGNGVVLLDNGSSFVSTGNDGFVADAGLKSNLRIVNGATWSDNGFIEVEGHIQIGNGSGTSALVIGVNDALRFTADDGGIVNGTGSTLINNGQLGKTAGSGTSTIGMGFSNTGTVLAASGTLKLSSAVAGSGAFLINAADTLELANGAVAGSNTVEMNGLGGLGATLRIDTNSTVAKPIIGLGVGSQIDLAAAASVNAVISGNTLVITPIPGSALNFVAAGSLAGLVVTTAPDGGSGTLVTLIEAPPPIVTLNLSPSASNAVAATLGTAVTGLAPDAITVDLTADADFATTGAGASTLVLNSGSLIYTPGLVTEGFTTSADTISYTVTDTKTGAVTDETQKVFLSDGPPPVVTVAAAPSASNVAKATLGTAAPALARAGDALSVSLTSDPDFASGSTLVLNSGGTLIYTPGLVTGALVGADTIKYAVQDVQTGAITTVTQAVTLSNGSPPLVTRAATPLASNSSNATLGTATPGVGTDALKVTLTSDADFASGSTLTLSGGSLIYKPGLVTAGLVGADTIKYTVTDTVTGGLTAVTQTVTLSNGPFPIVTLAATPSASNAVNATLGTAATGRAGDPLSVTLNSDPDFASGSKVALSGSTLVYTPGVVTLADVGSDSITYTVTDTVTGAVTQKTQAVTLSNGPSPIVTLAATTPSASNATPATLGTAAGHGGDALSVALTSDPDFASGSKVALSAGSLIYTPGPITLALAGADTIKYTVTDTVTGAVTNETQTVTLISSSPPVVTLAAIPTASNATTATLGTAAPPVGTDALSVALTSDADFASGSKVVLNAGGTLIYTPGLVTAGLVGADTIKYTVTDTVTGGSTAVTQGVTLSNGPGPVVTFASNPPIATNFTTALFGTAAGHGGDALSVTLTSDPDFASGSKVALTNGNLIYTPGAITPAKTGVFNIGYTVKDTVTGAVTPETQVVTIFDSIMTLTAAPSTVSSVQEISMFITPNGALNSRDSLTGGPNNPNTLALTGAGVFDLNSPKVLTNIQLATASEGQAAFVSGATNIASTTQTIFLRDGLSVDLTVGAGTPNASNPNPRVITIYGGNDGSVLNLGTGTDTVVLGSASEKVFGGGGTALVQATAAFAGAQVIGKATGTTTLEIAGGGTAALNVNDTHLTVKLDAATVLTLSKAAFVTALGSNGNDTIAAGAAGQVLTGGAGADTLTGFSGFGDTFSDTSAGLNGDLLKLFGGSDKIDLTDMAFASLKPLTFAAGVLTVADGTHTAKIDFTGSYTLANFHPATDTHTGTLISFVP